jgi:hypothetical protein
MKKLLWIGLLSLTLVLSSCEESNEGPYTVTFLDDTIDAVVVNNEHVIELPFLESDDGFFLGWEDTLGTLHKGTYTVTNHMTLTPVFEPFSDVLELKFNEEDKTVHIKRYNGEAERVKIPHMISDYIVRYIEMEAFKGTNPIRVDIPMTVYSIGMKSFSDMPNLEEIHYYGDYLGTVENVMPKNAFDAIIEANEICQSTDLTDEPTEENPWIFEDGCPVAEVTKRTDPVNGPDGNIYFSYHVLQPASEVPAIMLHQRFGFTPFTGSEQLTTITLPDKYSFFESEIFEGVPNLDAVYIENNPFIYSDNGVLYEQETDSLVYYPSGLLTEDFVVPSHINHISAWAFYGSTTETITLHDSITIEQGGFAYLKSLKTIILESDHERYTVSDGVLYNKDLTSLLLYPAGKEATTLSIPNTVEAIEAYAFMNQQHLEHIIVPEGVLSIENAAFMFLPSFITVDIASTVDYIAEGNFSQQERTLETLIIRNDQAVITAPALNILASDNLVIYIPDDLIQAYEGDVWWGRYTDYFVPLSTLDED